MRLADLEEYPSITIQCHDNPDADTVGAGYGLYCYFRSKGKNVRLIYSGQFVVQKTNLKLMLEKLNIPLEYYEPDGRHIEGLLITVDCQYGAGNVTRFPADEVAIIDHHPLAVTNVDKVCIHPNVGSCATLVWSMLCEEKYDVQWDVNLGTALYYGLYSDTNQFSEAFHPLDMSMQESVPVNKRLMMQFRNALLTLKELEIAGVAMIRYLYNEDYHFAVIKAQPCDPNLLGLISDFLIQVEEIDTCVVYNEISDGFKLSVRSCIREVNANELAVFLTAGIGSGGGHFEKAGGFISMKLYEEANRMLHSEAYFNDRMKEYFESFTVIYARKQTLDTSDMKCYRRKKTALCFVRVAELYKLGTQFSLRTWEGDRDMLLEEDIYLLLEQDGSCMIYSREDFFKYFQITEQKMPENYCEKAEYIPAAKSWKQKNASSLAAYAKVCYPREQFGIYARPLKKGAKVFTKWDEDKYLQGMPGDYLLVGMDDPHNISIERKDSFPEKYEQIAL